MQKEPFEITGVASVTDTITVQVGFGDDGVSVTKVTEMKTYVKHSENETRQTGDVAHSSLKPSTGQFLYSDAVKGKCKAPGAEHICGK